MADLIAKLHLKLQAPIPQNGKVGDERVKTKPNVIYHGNDNGNHSYRGQRLKELQNYN